MGKKTPCTKCGKLVKTGLFSLSFKIDDKIFCFDCGDEINKKEKYKQKIDEFIEEHPTAKEFCSKVSKTIKEDTPELDNKRFIKYADEFYNQNKRSFQGVIKYRKDLDVTELYTMLKLKGSKDPNLSNLFDSLASEYQKASGEFQKEIALAKDFANKYEFVKTVSEKIEQGKELLGKIVPAKELAKNLFMKFSMFDIVHEVPLFFYQKKRWFESDTPYEYLLITNKRIYGMIEPPGLIKQMASLAKNVEVPLCNKLAIIDGIPLRSIECLKIKKPLMADVLRITINGEDKGDAAKKNDLLILNNFFSFLSNKEHGYFEEEVRREEEEKQRAYEERMRPLKETIEYLEAIFGRESAATMNPETYLKIFTKDSQYVFHHGEQTINNWIELYGKVITESGLQGDICLDMPKELLFSTLGEPVETKKEVTKEFTKEKLFYKPVKGARGGLTYQLEIMVENGKIIAWKEN